jgi:hypothetical protein|nr:MAG TPA: hypothetical protein [Bacteriophage sp.]
MSVYEEKGILTYKDKEGNLHRMHPVTHRESIKGMESVDEHIANTDNPHQTSPEQIGAVSVDDVATLSEVKELLGIS